MPIPKTPQEILDEFSAEDFYSHDLRDALASVILWCAEEMPETTETEEDPSTSAYIYDQSRAFAIGQCRSILLQKADELTSPSKGEIKE